MRTPRETSHVTRDGTLVGECGGRDYSQRSEGERAKVRSRKGAGAAPVVPRALWTVPTGGGIRVWTGREITLLVKSVRMARALSGRGRGQGARGSELWPGPARPRARPVRRAVPPPASRDPREVRELPCRVCVSPHGHASCGGVGAPTRVLFLNSDRTRDTPHTPCFKVLRFGFSALRYAPPCAPDI